MDNQIEKQLEGRVNSLLREWNRDIKGKETPDALKEFGNKKINIADKIFSLGDWHEIDYYLRKIGSNTVFFYHDGIFYGKIGKAVYFEDLFSLEDVKTTEKWKEAVLVSINGRKYLPINTFNRRMSNFFNDVYKKKSDNINVQKAQRVIKKLLKQYYGISEFEDRKNKGLEKDIITLYNYHENGHENYWKLFYEYHKELICKWDKYQESLVEIGANWIDNERLSTYGFVRRIAEKDQKRAKKYLALDICFNLHSIIEEPGLSVALPDWVAANIERPLVIDAYNSEDISSQLAKGQKEIKDFVISKLDVMCGSKIYSSERSNILLNKILEEANEGYKKSFKMLDYLV